MSKYIIIIGLLIASIKLQSQPNVDDLFFIDSVNNPGPGYLSITLVGDKLFLLDNAGQKIVIKEFSDTKANYTNLEYHSNGLFTYFDFKTEKFYALNSNGATVDSFSTIGYTTDFHDIKFMSNGNVLLLGIDIVTVDMRQYDSDGKSNARITSFVIQEITPQKQVVWQWRCLDHFLITDATDVVDLTDYNIAPFHCNSFFIDTDGNILLSSRHLDEVTKINKMTGDIIWRLGGKGCKNNQFRFYNDTVNGFFGFSHQHDIQRLPNGNILLLDNGNMKGDDPYSRAVEYSIDETNKTVRKVWEHREYPDVFIPWMGSVQRLPNGNTLIGWGGLRTIESGESSTDTTLAVSEITPDGGLAFKMRFRNVFSYKAKRVIYNMAATLRDISSPGTYSFSQSNNNTGIEININSMSGSGYLQVEKHNYAPYNPQVTSQEPCVIYPYRWVITSPKINSISGNLTLNLEGLDNLDAFQNLKFFYRAKEGKGNFAQINTSFNSSSNELSAQFAGFGEYMIAANSISPPNLTDPLSNSLSVPTDGKLKWKNIYGAVEYQIQIALNANFTNLIYDETVYQTNSLNYYGLQYNRDYFWRIKSTSKNNCESQWSNIFKFRTSLNPPTLSAPPQNEVNVFTKGAVKWGVVTDATGYHLQISEDTLFTQIIVDNNNIRSNFYNYEGLDFYKQYYWRVAAMIDTNSNEWSDYWSFTTILKSPELIAPNLIKGVKRGDKLIWRASEIAKYYKLQISKVPDFAAIELERLGLSDTVFVLPKLQDTTQFYWRVKGYFEILTSDWSEPLSFKTIHPAPMHLLPDNNSIMIPLSGLISWHMMNIPNTKYRLQVSTDSAFGNIILEKSDLTSSYLPYDNFENNTTYYWRTNASNDEGISEWSEVWNFTTKPKIVLQSPEHEYPGIDEINIPVNGSISWKQVEFATKYRLQISEYSDFKSVILDKSELPLTHANYSDLANDKTYFWRVYAKNNEGASNWSEPGNFHTLLASPRLIQPMPNANEVPIEGKLEWHAAEGANSYSIEISSDPGYEEKLIESDIVSTFYNYTGLNYDTRYYWRVMAHNGAKISDWSNPRDFKTVAYVSVEKDETNIVDIGLYPNPAHESVYLQFDPKYQSITQLSIIDVFGNEIKLFKSTDWEMNQGLLRIDVSDLASGLYYLKLGITDSIKLLKIIKH